MKKMYKTNTLENKVMRYTPMLMMFIILGLSIGYSAFSSNLNISGIVTQVRIKKDVRVTGVSMVPETKEEEIPTLEYQVGDEVTFNPGDQNRTWNVIDQDSETVTLMLNENLGNAVGWNITDRNNSYGPKDAIEYLNTLTIDWNNVDPIESYSYINNLNGTTKNGYQKLEITNGLTKITNKDGSETTLEGITKAIIITKEEADTIIKKNNSTMPQFMYQNLYAPGGYWTLSSTNDPFGTIGVWVVSYDGYLALGSLYVVIDYGVRPVITIPKSELETTGINNKGGTTTYLEYNVSNIQAGLVLPNEDSSVTLKVEITNIGNALVGIKEIIGLPENLDYELLDYKLKDKICVDNVCKNGIVKEITLKLKYKENGYNSSKTTYNIVATFDFQEFYTVTYTDITNNSYPTDIIGGETLEIDFSGNAPSGIIVKINDVQTSNYTYENGILTVPKVNGNVEIEAVEIIIPVKSDGTPYKCIRATKLHTQTCADGDCESSGYTNGSTITFGNLGTDDNLSSGDAFDCDVNGDGDYDSKTERFYYVSDYYDGSTNKFNGNVAVLIYYNNTINGVPDNSNTTSVPYNSSGINYEGPISAVSYLPTIGQWSNMSLYKNSRQITDELGLTTTIIEDGPIEDGPIEEEINLPLFSYNGYSARLLTYQEISKSCNISIFERIGVSCNYLLENLSYVNNAYPQGYLLENPMNNSENEDSFILFPIGVFDVRVTSAYGVRPVIEVNKTDISTMIRI